MAEPWWMSLLREQHRAGFPDLTGMEGSVRLPISDRLLTRVIASRVPPAVPIQELDVRASSGNQVVIRLRAAGASFLPWVTVRLAIDEQPILPSSPVLGLRIVSQGMALMGGFVMRFLQQLPPGVQLRGDRLYVDLGTLLERYDAGEVLTYLSDLSVTTEEGRVIVAARAGIHGQT